MAKLTASELDDYSRVALPLLLARFPGWEPLAILSPRPDRAGSVLEVHVPCPSSAAESGLWVSTADEELTVGFHTHHRHFTDYEERPDLAQIEAGLDYAAAIVKERVGVLSYYRAGRFVGSRSVELPHVGPLPALYEGMGLLGKLAGWDQVSLRSWSGRLDRE
jgi:hypothetical protein